MDFQGEAMQDMKKRTCRIGNVELGHPFLLAPLAGITDSAFRQLCREQGAAMVYSEMVSAKGLYYRDKNTDELLAFRQTEKPIAYQLFGSEPEIMAWAAEALSSRENCILDINMGCPVPKVVKNGEGAALMRQPKLAAEIVASMAAAEAAAAERAGRLPKPVTVKCRMGWDKDSCNAVEFALRMQEAGASAVAVHGRTREQYYEGKADWEIIARVKEALDIPVIGSGDVFSGADAARMLRETGCDFVMAARGALGNPWIFREFSEAWRREADSPAGEAGATAGERLEMIRRHIDFVVKEKGENRGIREMRKHVGWYVKGIHGAAEIRRRVNAMTRAEDVLNLLEEMIRSGGE